MRNALLLSISFLLTTVSSFGQEDYRLHIDDQVIEVAMDKEYSIEINGKSVDIRISSKDTLLYDDELYSFKYPKDYSVSHTVIEEGIEQIMLMTAEGTGLLIQEYATFNPSLINEMMLSEVTKESLNYGFKMKRKDYNKTLASGEKIEVNKAILTYLDETNIYEVATIGKKDQGILIMTMIMDENTSAQGKEIIDLMWKTLSYK